MSSPKSTFNSVKPAYNDQARSGRVTQTKAPKGREWFRKGNHSGSLDYTSTSHCIWIGFNFQNKNTETLKAMVKKSTTSWFFRG